MKIQSKATAEYLTPITREKLGDAILDISLHYPQSTVDTQNEDSSNCDNVSRDNVSRDHLRPKFRIEIYDESTAPDDSGIPIVYRNSPRSYQAQSFPQRFKHGKRRVYAPHAGIYHDIYDVPISDFSIALFFQTWTAQRRISQEANVIIQSMLVREQIAENNAERTAILKSYLETKLNAEKQYAALLTDEAKQVALPSLVSSITQPPATNPFLDNLPSPYKLSTYQKVAANNILDSQDGFALFCDPGLGKTIISIQKLDMISLLKHSSDHLPAKILILCPKNIRSNWLQELRHFSRCAFQVTILSGSSQMIRELQLVEAVCPKQNVHAAIVIAGYESVVGTPIAQDIEWDLIIVDESHSIASPSTARTKFILSLRNNSKFRIILTGTPIRNSPFDLYTQLEFLFPGCSGHESYHAFKEFYGVWSNSQWKGVRELTEFANIPLLKERLSKYAFLLTKEEALPYLPERSYDIMECSLSQQQYQVYRQLASLYMAEIDAIDSPISARNVLTKLLKLAEITSGFVKTDDGSVHRFDPNPKLELLTSEVKDYLSQNPTSKVQIWCTFQENIKQIAYRFNDIERIKTVRYYGQTSDQDRIDAEHDFNCDPSTRIFVGNPTAGGAGLNLLGFDPYNPNDYETNSEWTIYYSQNWSSVSRRQSEARSHRRGTRVPIRITTLLVPGSIDQEIHERVQSKIDLAENIQDLKNVLSNLLSNLQVNGD